MKHLLKTAVHEKQKPINTKGARMNWNYLKENLTDQDIVSIREALYAQEHRLKQDAIARSCQYTNARAERLAGIYDKILLAQLDDIQKGQDW